MSYVTYNGKMVQSNNKFVIIPAASSSFDLTWDNISNVPPSITDPTNVSQWNTLFDLPTWGTAFTSASVNGNVVSLGGGNNIQTKSNLFLNNPNLVKVQDNINCIVEVRENAFYGCTGLSDISLPVCTSIYSTPSSTPTGSFQNCINLVSANFPSLRIADLAAFKNCSSLGNVDFSSLEEAANYSFEGCRSLTNPDFSSLIYARSYSFEGCSSLNTLWPNLQLADQACFAHNRSIVNLTLPSIITIGFQTFYGCTNLTTLHIETAANLGPSAGNDFIFQLDVSMLDLYVDISKQTNNGGNPDGDITYLQGVAPGVTIHYIA